MKKLKIYRTIIAIGLFALVSCDGGIVLKVYTYTDNSVEGLFVKDTTLDGTPIGNVSIMAVLADDGEKTPMAYNRVTDSKGKFEDILLIPPLKHNWVGSIIVTDKRFVNDTLRFSHSSNDKRVCIINLKSK